MDSFRRTQIYAKCNDRLVYHLDPHVRRAQDDPKAKVVLSHNLVDRFVPIHDRDYHDIRFMSSVSGEAELLTIR